MIYYPFGLQAVGIRFKNSLNENAKMHAFTEDVIETCHNGVVSWEKKSKLQPILIEGQDDHIKTKERWIILKKLLQLNDVEYNEIISNSGGILSKLVTLIYLLDYTSIYLAIKSNIDPTPVRSIEFIKKEL
jgi:glucose/mannose-6-phosphate isomerase